MDRKKGSAGIDIALAKGPSEPIGAGSEFSLSVHIGWPAGMGADRAVYRIREGERTIRDGALPKPAFDGTIEFHLDAPEEVGEHRWELLVSAAQDQGGKLREGSLPIVFATVPHATSLAVWDVPSPVVRGAWFEVKVGGKCSASCRLDGRTVEICDEADRVVGRAVLRDTTLPETMGLYWTSVSLKAPRKIKLNAWTARFLPVERKPAHGGSLTHFSFVTVAEPENSVFVKVVDKKTKTPIANAQVRLGIYRAITNEKGAAKIMIPSGEFSLIVTRAGYEMPERRIAVSKDVRVRIPAQKLPEEDPFAVWTA